MSVYDPMAELRKERDEEAARSRGELRDSFARAALPALVTEFLASEASAEQVWDDYDELASSAYMIADAMLRARENPQ